MVIPGPRADRPAPLAAGAHAEDGRAPAFLLRDAKALAAAEKSRRPAVAGMRSGAAHPRQIAPSRTRRVGRAESRKETWRPSSAHDKSAATALVLSLSALGANPLDREGDRAPSLS